MSLRDAGLLEWLDDNNTNDVRDLRGRRAHNNGHFARTGRIRPGRRLPLHVSFLPGNPAQTCIPASCEHPPGYRRCLRNHGWTDTDYRKRDRKLRVATRFGRLVRSVGGIRRIDPQNETDHTSKGPRMPSLHQRRHLRVQRRIPPTIHEPCWEVLDSARSCLSPSSRSSCLAHIVCQRSPGNLGRSWQKQGTPQAS